MAEKPTSKRKTVKRDSKKPLANKNPENGSSLVEKIFPSLVIVTISAIFYFTGWVYISHWYSYYGIDATRINIPIQIILLHGFPGILFMGVCGLVAILGVAFYRNLFYHSPLHISDIPTVVVLAYLISLVIIFIAIVVILYVLSNIAIPPEAWISFLSLLLIIFVYSIVYQARKEFQNFNTDLLGTTIGILIGVIREKGAAKGVEFLQDITIKKDENLLDTIRQTDREIKDLFRSGSERAMEIIKNTWSVWISAVLVFYFLTSVSSSAILGEWDAARGGRSLIGNWHIPEVSLFSTASIPALEKFENKISAGFEYKPLGLLSSDDRVYYLVDWKTSGYYAAKPNVYIIPQLDSLSLNFIVSPYVPQTPSQTPTITSTPTLMPAATITPIP
jgi:uncharacterized protein YebE (UPF0316 family)